MSGAVSARSARESSSYSAHRRSENKSASSGRGVPTVCGVDDSAGVGGSVRGRIEAGGLSVRGASVSAVSAAVSGSGGKSASDEE